MHSNVSSCLQICCLPPPRYCLAPPQMWLATCLAIVSLYIHCSLRLTVIKTCSVCYISVTNEPEESQKLWHRRGQMSVSALAISWRLPATLLDGAAAFLLSFSFSSSSLSVSSSSLSSSSESSSSSTCALEATG